MYIPIKQKLKSNLSEKQIDLIRKIISLSQLAYEDIRVNILGQVFPMKPTAISMMANDVCNSRCQMCLIWQQKKDFEVSPEDLAQIFSDPLFTHVQNIGITGGEPTLRTDLPELFKVACTTLPQLSSASMITNAIIEDIVKQRVLECADICNHYGKGFSVSVSLDGIGEVHDTVRGRKNNFDSAINVIQYLRDQGIKVTFGCTITHSNAPYIDELLDYAKQEEITGTFRVAEYIDRLYNSNQTNFIRNFDKKTAYHLGLFFFRAEHDFQTNTAIQKTYRSIRRMLTEGKPRTTGCPYHTRTVILTSRGDLLYCSPKSPIIGNTLKESAAQLYYQNLNKRQEIIKNHCDDCIHDYHVPVTFREKISFFLKCNSIHKKYNCSDLVKKSAQVLKQVKNISDTSTITTQKVLIVGWYGTETVGDKAILWTIIKRLRSRSQPPITIYLSSMHPFICEYTVKEMGLENIIIVETWTQEFEKACDEVEEIIVGGGPLMDLEGLNHILYAFIQGAKSGAINRIEGCGIGPLVNPLYVKVVNEICRLSDHITLRDQTSTNRCLNEFESSAITVADPATEYIDYLKSKPELLQQTKPVLGNKNNVSCFLREWLTNYSEDRDESSYRSIKEKFEDQLVGMLTFIAETKNLDIHLLPMHTFYEGGDDRVFNRYLAKKVSVAIQEKEPESRVRFARLPVSPLEIVHSMHHANFNICMRFHSVLFAETLGIPYLAIDYTGGGKIKAFLEEKGKLDRLISLSDFADGKWRNYLEKLL
ncbi:radical SAM protein [Picosynechococcus sp. PCC 7003]|uniref:polysaccharide pyruvyl transferase family protein n=1 Tax=Picosynechococcus sp. PCC 7003 TaxID=374981 RepID=UPI000810DB20|nr:polysaccharide pyruvyl transferase family protein [Picosynechococcus sp. PCC 7003]ANV84729.1 radical SAM protein [Picosynechococcus sp. PCC 7003]